MKTWLPVLFLLVATPGLSRSGPAAAPEGTTDSRLEDKLTHQFARYALARGRLLARLADTSLPPEQRLVSRGEWETWLQGQGDDAIGATDLAALRTSQRQRIDAARQRAADASLFDLQRLRTLPAAQARQEMTAFCAAMPKGGMLHVHPGGTLTRSTGASLLEAKDPVLPFQAMVADFIAPENHLLLYPSELQWLEGLGGDTKFSNLTPENQAHYLDFLALPLGNHPFERFDSAFEFVDTALADWGDMEVAIRAFAQRAAAEGVLYVELRTGVRAASLTQVAAVLQRVETETGVMLRVDDSFNRTATEAQRAEALADLESLPDNQWIVGIDLLGNERTTPALETGQVVYGTVLQRVLDGKSKLHRTMHAGEIGDPRNPRDAMILGVERLGHAVLLAEDPVALEYAARQRLPVEVNLVSNLRLEAVADLARHPFLDYLRLGSPVSLSTDDEGILDTDIDHECVTAMEVSDVSYAELKAMAYNSLKTGFLADADKATLLARLDGQFAAFERRELGNPVLSGTAPLPRDGEEPDAIRAR